MGLRTDTGALQVNTDGIGTLSGFDPGSILFVDADGLLSQDNANLFWDDTNNRLGIGNATPAVELDVGSSSAAFRVRNSATEWFEADWTSNVLSLGTNMTGAGVARSLLIVQGGIRVLGHPNGGADTTSWSSGPYTLATQSSNNLFNTAFGINSLFSNTSGSNNVAIGYSSLYTNSTGTTNLAIGLNALSANTTGSYNVAMGGGLGANTTGSGNVGIGIGALGSNTTAGNNVALGANALGSNTSGSENMALGASALFGNTSGMSNIGIGVSVLYNNAISDTNIGIGNYSLYDLVSVGATGANVAIGHNTGRGVVTGAGNTIIGANVGGLAAGLSNAIVFAEGSGGIKLDYGMTTASMWTASARVRAPVLSTTGYTVATLPAGTLGDKAYVTDALAPAFVAVVVGGGAVKTPVFYDGTNWVGG